MTARRLVERALELGVNLIDTAEVYALGRSERIVGDALAGGLRDQAFVATKILPVLPLPGVVEWRAQGSARRLRTDRLDLYQLHFPNPLVPLSATMGALRRLQAGGLVGHVGVSNYSPELWRRAESALGAPVLSNQVRFSLLSPRPAEDLVPYAASHDRLVIAYSPLGQGLLGGGYRSRRRPRGVVRRLSGSFAGRERLRPIIDAVQQVAARHGATPAQVALAWVISHPNTVAIPGASSLEQLEQNVAAADLALSEDDRASLVAAARRVNDRGNPGEG